MFGSFLNIGRKSSVRSNIASNYGGLVSGHHEVNDKNEKKKKDCLIEQIYLIMCLSGHHTCLDFEA